MAGPTLDAIGIVASDVAQSIAFYTRLGLDFGGRVDDHVEAVSTGGVRVMIDSESMVRSFDPAFEGNPNGRVGLAFLCDSAADVDALYTGLEADGHGKTAPFDAPWGQRYAQVVDPDGQSVDLFAPL